MYPAYDKTTLRFTHMIVVCEDFVAKPGQWLAYQVNEGDVLPIEGKVGASSKSLYLASEAF